MAWKRNSLSDASREHWLPQVGKSQWLCFGEQSCAGLGIRRVIGDIENLGRGRHRSRRRGQRRRRSDEARDLGHGR